MKGRNNSMKRFQFVLRTRWLLSLFLMVLGVSSSALALADPEVVAKKSQQSVPPDVLVKDLTDSLVGKLKTRKEDAPEVFYRNAVEEVLGPYVDFVTISRRVMAKYYKDASEEQRERFATSFKESLINTYANGLSAFNDQKIVVLPFEGVRKKGSKERATVDMKITTSDGTVYPITYALYRVNGGKWKLENIVLNGVNLGLTFRNQFYESYRTNGGNIDKVIKEWNVELATADTKAKN